MFHHTKEKLQQLSEKIKAGWQKVQAATALERSGKNEIALRGDHTLALLAVAAIICFAGWQMDAFGIRSGYEAMQKGAQHVTGVAADLTEALPRLTFVDAKILAQQLSAQKVAPALIHPQELTYPFIASAAGFEMQGHFVQQNCVRVDRFSAANFTQVNPITDTAEAKPITLTLASGQILTNVAKVNVVFNPNSEGQSPISVNNLSMRPDFSFKANAGILGLAEIWRGAGNSLRALAGQTVPDFDRLPISKRAELLAQMMMFADDRAIEALNGQSKLGAQDVLRVFLKQNPIIEDVEFISFAPVTGENVQGCSPQFPFRALRQESIAMLAQIKTK